MPTHDSTSPFTDPGTMATLVDSKPTIASPEVMVTEADSGSISSVDTLCNLKERNDSSLAQSVHLRIVFDLGQKQYVCDRLAITVTASGEEVMKRLHSMHDKGSGRLLHFLRAAKEVFLIQRAAVMVVCVSRVGQQSHVFRPPTLTS